MEPRPFSRGDKWRELRLSMEHSADSPMPGRFNGAATIQSRRPVKVISQGWCPWSFNGAATIQSRRPAHALWVLQWSRDHSVAETRPPAMARRRTDPSLQWSRDHSVAETACTARLPSTFTPILRVKHRPLTCPRKSSVVWPAVRPLTGSILPSKLRALPIWQMHHRTARTPTLLPICPHRRHYHITVRPPSPPVPPASVACPTYSASQSPGHVLDRCLLSGPCPP